MTTYVSIYVPAYVVWYSEWNGWGAGELRSDNDLQYIAARVQNN